MDIPAQQLFAIYCDIDGVLADFDAGITKVFHDLGYNFSYNSKRYAVDKKYRDLMWKAISEYQRRFGFILWRYLPLMHDAHQLWGFIKPYHAQILTAAGPARYHAMEQKREWVTENFGSNIRINIVESAKNKASFATPSRILIDDQMRAIGPWVDAGGIGVHHTSAANTIRQLKEIFTKAEQAGTSAE